MEPNNISQLRNQFLQQLEESRQLGLASLMQPAPLTPQRVQLQDSRGFYINAWAAIEPATGTLTITPSPEPEVWEKEEEEYFQPPQRAINVDW